MLAEAAIAAGSSLLGGYLSNKANEKNNAANLANAQKQYEQQKEFAQSGIQWKVKDAEAAGIHPLYALGANTISYAPQSVGSNPNDFGFLKETGQNIGRAIDATRSLPARAEALQTTAATLTNEGLALDNDLKRTQLASAAALASQPGTGPGLPGAFQKYVLHGQGDAGVTDPSYEHKIVPPQFTPGLKAFGHTIDTSSDFSDAQSYEDRYGDGTDNIMGAIIAGADLYQGRQLRNHELWHWLRKNYGSDNQAWYGKSRR